MKADFLHCVPAVLGAAEAVSAPSQVQHFDKLHEKEVRLVQTLHSNINQTKSKTGRLAGEPQPTEEQHS